jgi:hypothetical protein
MAIGPHIPAQWREPMNPSAKADANSKFQKPNSKQKINFKYKLQNEKRKMKKEK